MDSAVGRDFITGFVEVGFLVEYVFPEGCAVVAYRDQVLILVVVHITDGRKDSTLGNGLG